MPLNVRFQLLWNEEFHRGQVPQSPSCSWDIPFWEGAPWGIVFHLESFSMLGICGAELMRERRGGPWREGEMPNWPGHLCSRSPGMGFYNGLHGFEPSQLSDRELKAEFHVYRLSWLLAALGLILGFLWGRGEGLDRALIRSMLSVVVGPLQP